MSTLAILAIAATIVVVAARSAVSGEGRIHKELSLSTPGAVVALAWSPDGQKLVAASDWGSALTVWDRSGKQLTRIMRNGGGPTLDGSIAFLRGSRQIVFPPPGDAPADAALSVWDVAGGHFARSVAGPQPGAGRFANHADHFVVTPDQSRIATASVAGGVWKTYRNNVWIYSAYDWRILGEARLEDGVDSLASLNGGRVIAAGLDHGRVALLNAASATVIHEYQVYEQSPIGSFVVGAIAGSPDGRWILAGVGTGYINGPFARTPQTAWEHSFEPVTIMRANDGIRVASLASPKSPIRAAAWDPKDRYVAILDNADQLFVWRPPFSEHSFDKISLNHSSHLALAISPGGDRLAVAADSGVVIYVIN